jgi:hypothetical protein
MAARAAWTQRHRHSKYNFKKPAPPELIFLKEETVLKDESCITCAYELGLSGRCDFHYKYFRCQQFSTPIKHYQFEMLVPHANETPSLFISLKYEYCQSLFL